MCAQRFLITVITDANSWINNWIPKLLSSWRDAGHEITWLHEAGRIPNGDVCFLLSYGKIVKKEILLRNHHNLVVHESALPQGKGWSPMTWQILEGKNEIAITLFEASESVDSGVIYLQKFMKFDGNELLDELHQVQAKATMHLCDCFIANYPTILEKARFQDGLESFYPKRRPKDSQLDPSLTLAEQFNLLRVVDNERYPAFFEWQGQRYKLKIEKI